MKTFSNHPRLDDSLDNPPTLILGALILGVLFRTSNLGLISGNSDSSAEYTLLADTLESRRAPPSPARLSAVPMAGVDGSVAVGV